MSLERLILVFTAILRPPWYSVLLIRPILGLYRKGSRELLSVGLVCLYSRRGSLSLLQALPHYRVTPIGLYSGGTPFALWLPLHEVGSPHRGGVITTKSVWACALFFYSVTFVPFSVEVYASIWLYSLLSLWLLVESCSPFWGIRLPTLLPLWALLWLIVWHSSKGLAATFCQIPHSL